MSVNYHTHMFFVWSVNFFFFFFYQFIGFSNNLYIMGRFIVLTPDSATLRLLMPRSNSNHIIFNTPLFNMVWITLSVLFSTLIPVSSLCFVNCFGLPFGFRLFLFFGVMIRICLVVRLHFGFGTLVSVLCILLIYGINVAAWFTQRLGLSWSEPENNSASHSHLHKTGSFKDHLLNDSLGNPQWFFYGITHWDFSATLMLIQDCRDSSPL